MTPQQQQMQKVKIRTVQRGGGNGPVYNRANQVHRLMTEERQNQSKGMAMKRNMTNASRFQKYVES